MVSQSGDWSKSPVKG